MNIKLVEDFDDARAELRCFDRNIDATLSERLPESNVREKFCCPAFLGAGASIVVDPNLRDSVF